MVKKRIVSLRRFLGFPIFVGVMRISGILVHFKTLQFKLLCSLLTMRREVSEHIFKNHLVLKKYGYYRCWRSIFFFLQKMHAICNCTLCITFCWFLLELLVINKFEVMKSVSNILLTIGIKGGLISESFSILQNIYQITILSTIHLTMLRIMICKIFGRWS